MIIRRVCEDNPALDKLDATCFPGDELYPKAGAFWWLLLDRNDGAVGFAGLKDVGYSTAFLCRAGVLSAHRGQGLQRRLIRVRVAAARRLGYKCVITYTSPHNPASSNNLIREGFKVYDPEYPYGMDGALYFIKEL